jgi:hypothetical protein
MKILLVSEGEHEPGAVKALVGRLLHEGIEFELDRVKRNDIHAHHGKGAGYFKRAVRWLMEAEKRDVDALILVIDEDGQEDRSLQLTQAQQCQLSELPRAFGVAVRTFDAWMLADEKALVAILRMPIQRQPNPETIPNPKDVCRHLHLDSPNNAPLRDIYADLLGTADIKLLENRCPKGFAPFADRIRGLE